MIHRSVMWFVALVLFFGVRHVASAQSPFGDAVQNASHTVAILNKQVSESVLAAPPEVKQAVAEVPQVNQSEVHEIAAPQNPVKKIIVLDDAQRLRLIAAVDKFTQEKKRQEREYSQLALLFIIGAAGFALIASIFNFIRWNVAAGIVGLIVIAVVGFPNLYPIPALADFYGGLATQAAALQIDCELKNPFTEDDYSTTENQLKLLILYEANNRPKLGTTKVSTEDLAKQLQTYKTSASIKATAPQ